MVAHDQYGVVLYYPACMCASAVKQLLLCICQSVNNIEIPFKQVT